VAKHKEKEVKYMSLNLKNKTVPLTAFSVLTFLAGLGDIPFISALLPAKYYMYIAAIAAAAAGVLRAVKPTLTTASPPEEDKTIKPPEGYTVLPMILILFLVGVTVSGCVHYKDSYTAYAQAQAAMASAAGPLIRQTFDAQGKLVGQEMGNMAVPMAMILMGKPESELVQVITKIMNFAPWAVVGWVAQAGFNAAGGGNTNSYVVGDGNIAGQQQAGTSMGTAPTSTSNTNVTVPIEAAGVLN
jgi:hypothetical protein